MGVRQPDVPTNRVPAWDNGHMSINAVEGGALQHVIVVGGTVAEWSSLPDDLWVTRLAEMGKVADHAGACWLTIRPFGAASGDSAQPHSELSEQSTTVGNCHVVAQPAADGRTRLAAAVAELQAQGQPITESTIGAMLNAPAAVDPDLVVVVGGKSRLPRSLVWELAYSELVFVDTSWQHFAPAHLEEALGSFAHRHRRFGGID